MDLSRFDVKKGAESGVRVYLRDPLSSNWRTAPILRDDDGEALWVDCLGKDSDKWQAKLKEIMAAQAKNENPEPGDSDRAMIELVSACTTGYSDNIELDSNGTKPKDAAEIYQRCEWIAEQVIARVTDRSQYFLERSAS